MQRNKSRIFSTSLNGTSGPAIALGLFCLERSSALAGDIKPPDPESSRTWKAVDRCWYQWMNFVPTEAFDENLQCVMPISIINTIAPSASTTSCLSPNAWPWFSHHALPLHPRARSMFYTGHSTLPMTPLLLGRLFGAVDVPAVPLYTPPMFTWLQRTRMRLARL